MAGIEFEEDQFQSMASVRAEESKPPTLTERIIKWGLAKDEQQALYILIGISVVSLLITFYLIFGKSDGGPLIFEPDAPIELQLEP